MIMRNRAVIKVLIISWQAFQIERGLCCLLVFELFIDEDPYVATSINDRKLITLSNRMHLKNLCFNVLKN